MAAPFRILLDGNAYDPTNFGQVSVQLTLGQEKGGYYFRRELTDKLQFRGAAYQYILTQINLGQCQQIDVVIDEYCNGGWENIITSYFTRQNATVKYDQCVIEVELEKNDEYTCLLEGDGQTDVNILAADWMVLPREDITYQPVYGLEVAALETASPACGVIPDWGAAYGYFASASNQYCIYARYVVRTRCAAGDPQEPAPALTPWNLLSDDCAIDGTATFWRNVQPTELTLILTTNTCIGLNCTPALCSLLCFNVRGIDNSGGYLPSDIFLIDPVPPFEYERICACAVYTQFTIPNGRNLVNTMDYILSQTCPTLTIESELLTNETNYVTGSTKNPLTDLFLFQKSDVVNPTASEVATIGNISIVNLLGDLSKLLNSMWYVDTATNKLVFEHVTAVLTNTLGIDLTVYQGGKWARYKNTISYDKDQIPKEETFTYQNDANAVDFVGFPITYNSDCTKADPIETRTEYLETEITRIFQNPQEGLTGFVLVAIESILQDDNKSEPGELTGLFIPNAPLAWANLHRDYFYDYRYLTDGTLNNAPAVFNSTRPVKKQDVEFPLCCLNDFNPRLLIRTEIGDGRPQTAIYDLSTKMLKVTIKFEDL